MARITYGTWNIQKFSVRHLKSATYHTTSATSGFRKLSVKHLIARKIMRNDPDVIGILEVTLGTGGVATTLLRDAMNERSEKKGLDREYAANVSERNVSKNSKQAKKADSYAIILDKKVFDTKFHSGIVRESYRDRKPYWFELNELGSTNAIDFLLWHAPNPQNMLSDQQSELQALEGTINERSNANPGRPFVISGDFNLDSRASAFDIITNLGFHSIFEGVKTMVLSSESAVPNIEELYRQQDEDKRQIRVKDVAKSLLGNSYDNIFIRNVTYVKNKRLNMPILLSSLGRMKSSDHVQINEELIGSLCYSVTKARNLSDHCPVFVTFSV